VGRGLAYGDFDRDGDIDLLMTTNNGPAVLFRNDQVAGNRSLRLRLVGRRRTATPSARRAHQPRRHTQTRIVKSGSSYLSQSELPVTFGVGRRDVVDRAWSSSGRTDGPTSSHEGGDRPGLRVRGGPEAPPP
jgi:enediyne biosynthesis protein E4